MSNKEKKALNQLIKGRNVEICVNDTDKNLGQLVRTKTTLFWNAVDNFMTSSRTIKYRGKKRKN